MIDVVFYNTILDSEHHVIVSNVENYLSTLTPLYETPYIDRMGDADEILINIPYNIDQKNIPNYAVTRNEDTSSIAFYFVRVDSITTNTMRCTLSIDLWATARLYDDVAVTGELVNAHDMPDLCAAYGDENYANFTWPIAPVCGDFIDSVVPAEEGWNKICAVASVTIDFGDYTDDVLVATPPRHIITDDTVLLADIGNLSRIKSLSNKDVLSVNRLWLFPANGLGIYINPNTGDYIQPNTTAAVNDLEASIEVYSYTLSNTASYFLDADAFRKKHYVVENGVRHPAFHRLGNFGTAVDAPLNGLLSQTARIDYYANWDIGYLSAVLRMGAESIEFTTSLSVAISAERATERSTTRQIGDVLGILSSVVSVGGSIALKSPVGIAASATAFIDRVSNIATRINYTHSVIDGNAFQNLYVKTGTTRFTGLPCAGYMAYTMANSGEVESALKCVGYAGRLFLHNFLVDEKTYPVFGVDYAGTYRRFNMPRVTTGYTRAKAAIEEMCANGFTIYYTNTPDQIANVGAPLRVSMDFS